MTLFSFPSVNAVNGFPGVRAERGAQLIWSALTQRQSLVVSQFGSEHTKHALTALGLNQAAIPDPQVLTAKLLKASDWRLFPATGQNDQASTRSLCHVRATRIPMHMRNRNEFDSPHQPDYFSAAFGTVSTLMHAEFANFMHALGQTQLKVKADPPASSALKALSQLLSDWSMSLNVDALGVERKPGLFGARLVSGFSEAQSALKEGTCWVKPTLDELMLLCNASEVSGFRNAPAIYPVVADWEKLEGELKIWFTNWQSSQPLHPEHS